MTDLPLKLTDDKEADITRVFNGLQFNFMIQPSSRYYY